jgi:hypothetical protein
LSPFTVPFHPIAHLMKRHLTFLLCCLLFQTALHARQPNVVLFLVDDMGWMDSEPYGSKYYETRT